MSIFTIGCCTLYCGDAPEMMRKWIEPESIDACLTDPPYPRTYTYLYGAIAQQLQYALVRGGSYMAIVPHYNMPTVLANVGQYLKWRWICAMWQDQGTHPRMAMGIEVMWKPICWWVKEAWPAGRGFRKDGFANPPPEKEHHKWEQTLDWANYCLKFVPPGGRVLDPCLGGGTMALACAEQGIPFIGIDNDPAAIEITAERLEAFYKDK